MIGHATGSEETPMTAAGAASVTGTRGPVGNTRSIGLSILWFILTLSIYGFYWVYKIHEEIKRYSGNGIGGVLGLVIYFLISPVTFFVVPSEVTMPRQSVCSCEAFKTNSVALPSNTICRCSDASQLSQASMGAGSQLCRPAARCSRSKARRSVLAARWFAVTTNHPHARASTTCRGSAEDSGIYAFYTPRRSGKQRWNRCPMDVLKSKRNGAECA